MSNNILYVSLAVLISFNLVNTVYNSIIEYYIPIRTINALIIFLVICIFFNPKESFFLKFKDVYVLKKIKTVIASLFLFFLFFLGLNQFLDICNITNLTVLFKKYKLLYDFTFFIAFILGILIVLGNQKFKINYLSTSSLEKDKKFDILIFFLIIFSFFLKLYIGMNANIDPDEGQLIYDAHLMNSGLIPFIDFSTRSPLILYFLIALEKLLGGYSLLNSKILISFFMSLSILMVYLISNKTYNNKRISFISCLVFTATPYLMFYSYVLHVSQSLILFLLITFYFFTIYIKDKNIYALILTSFFMVLSFLTRRETIIYIPLFLVFIFYINKGLKNKIKSIFNFSFFAIIFFIIISWPILKNIGFLKFDEYYGISSLLAQTSGDSIEASSSKYYIIFSWFVLIFPLTYLLAKYLIEIVLKFYKKTNLNTSKIGFYLTLVLSTLGFIFLNNQKTGTYNILEEYYLSLYLLCYAFVIFVVEIFWTKINFNFYKNKSFLFIFSQILFFLFVMMIKINEYHLSYFLSITSLLIIIFTPIISIPLLNYVYKNIFKKFIIFTILFILFLNQNIAFIKADIHERKYSYNLINEVDKNIQSLSSEDDVIFTVDTTLAINSKREIRPPITHHRIYDNTDCLKYDLNLPCLSEVGQILEKNNVKLIIGGFRTEYLIKSNKTLNNYIKEHYKIAKTINNKDNKPEVIFYTLSKNNE